MNNIRNGRPAAPMVRLDEVIRSLERAIASVLGRRYEILPAEPPAPPRFLATVFARRRGPVQRQSIPATDGVRLWLPAYLGIADRNLALERYRVMALQQAMRAMRGGADLIAGEDSPLVQDFFLLIEACAADASLQRLSPELAAPVAAARRAALAARPSLYAFPKSAQPLERFVRRLMQSDRSQAEPVFDTPTAARSIESAKHIAGDLMPDGRPAGARRTTMLFRDRWTGEFRAADPCDHAGGASMTPLG
ncbi:MAG TPA: hypothetical protein VHG33_03530, partial [Woeseiaceae bacterium]|nr:hypothetical protein [Woeseiaceae bacterium]